MIRTYENAAYFLARSWKKSSTAILANMRAMSNTSVGKFFSSDLTGFATELSSYVAVCDDNIIAEVLCILDIAYLRKNTYPGCFRSLTLWYRINVTDVYIFNYCHGYYNSIQ